MDVIEDRIETDIAKSQDLETTSLDDILKDKLLSACHKETSNVCMHNISKIVSQHSAIDLAYAVSHLPIYARLMLFDSFSDLDAKVAFIVNTDSDSRVKILRFMRDKELKSLFEKMPTDEAVFISDDMSERRFRRIMELIDPKKAFRIREQKKHERNSAGRLMSNEYFAFRMDLSIKEAALRIRDNPNIDFTKGVFITDDEGKLQGVVPTRNLLINKKDVLLKQIMRANLYSVSPEATREEVVDIVERYKVSQLPVVDENNKIIGVIEQEDVIETIEDLADETIAKITGTSEKVSATDPLIKRFFTRAPWLIVTLLAGLINVGVMSSFQKHEGAMLTFALFFVPLITGMSGNIGIQCSTVLVRSMALGVFPAKMNKNVLAKELFIGFFTGILFGIFCAIVVYLIDYFILSGGALNALYIGAIIGVGLIGACFAGTILGVFSPIFFARMGIDPAVSSGPIVTAFNDFFSMTIYFLIAWGMGSLFFG